METVRNLQNQLTMVVSENPTFVVAGVCVTSLAICLSTRFLRSKPPSSDPPDTLVVHGMGDKPEVPSLSPFVLKLETYLKLAKVPYVLSDKLVASSKGKFPWISYNGQKISDSQFCIEFVRKQFGVDLNQGLTAEQKAVAHAFRVMMEEFHFWCNTYFRFYEVNDPTFQKALPLRLVRYLVKRRINGYLHAQGLGRHTKGEVLQLYTANLQAVQDFLGDKPFMMGDNPTEVDCSVYGILASLYFYAPAEIFRLLGNDYLQNKYPKLYEYVLRMKKLTYPDYQG